LKPASYPAFHVIWTKPFTATGRDFSMNDAEILTMVISALMWQKYNGTIKLYTDKTGYEFIKKHDLPGLWDGGIDTEVLESNNYPINPEIFWAAGKLMALEANSGACVILDTDLIVTRPINDILESSAIAALHPEALNPEVYLNPSLLKFPTGFKFPDFYNWDVLPSNTAFLYIKDDSFKNFYLSESKRFMFHNAEKPEELVSQMVFAEQRLLSICADYMKIPVNHLLTEPFSPLNDSLIHLWGFKSLLRQNSKIQTIYMKQLLKSFGEELSASPHFQKYMKKQPFNS